MKYALYILRENERGEMLKSEASKQKWVEVNSPSEIQNEVAGWMKRGYELIANDEIQDWGRALYFAHKDDLKK